VSRLHDDLQLTGFAEVHESDYDVLLAQVKVVIAAGYEYLA